MTGAINEIAAAFEVEHPETDVRLNFAASSLLAKQIVLGAPADLYISANPDWMNFLQQKKLLLKNSRRSLLANKLVLVVPAKSQLTLNSEQDLLQLNIKRIAVADWSHVPAGIYARQALQAAGLWQQIKNKCLPALNARAALVYVERGDVDCGIVYASDVAVNPRVRLVFTLADSLQPVIRYSIALTQRAKHPSASDFFAYLFTSRSQKIFTNHSFLTIPRENEQR